MKNITKLTKFKLSSNNTLQVTQSLQQEVTQYAYRNTSARPQ